MYSFRAQIKTTFNTMLTVLGTALGMFSLISGFPADVRAGGGAGRNRLVHHFDFNEREIGNLEDIPKFWVAVRPRGFAHFATGAFDLEVGRDAPPSFHLSSEGRNVAYHYAGPETRVRANSEYRIRGHILADGLVRARACLSAHFLSADGKPLAGTLVRSRYVGGEEEPGRWRKVKLELPPAPPEARTIGLIAWVLQEHTWQTTAPLRRHIPRIDVRAGAWFDDISINAMPHVEVTTSAPGQVLVPGEPRELHVVLADDEDVGLVGQLSITDAAGNLVEIHTIKGTTGEYATPARISIDHLQPGLYEALLSVRAGTETISSRRIRFVQLAERIRSDSRSAASFGVVIEPTLRADTTDELALLRRQAIRSVKLPVWSGLPDDPPTPQEKRETDRLLQSLAKDGFALTGVFFGPPSAIVRADGAYPRPLAELLAGPPSEWEEHLASVVVPYASLFHWWQMGRDGGTALSSVDELRLAASQLEQAMRQLVTMPLLAIPTTTTAEPAVTKYPAQQLALSISTETPPDWVSRHIQSFGSLGYDHVSVFVEPLPTRQYRRIPRLADWAQRIITARHSGVSTVFVPQTWSVRNRSGVTVAEPLEEYLFLRTIADVISDATPGQRLSLSPTIKCLVFHDEDSSILAIWDSAAPPEGSSAVIQLGEADKQIDLWGNAESLGRDAHSRQIVRLSAMPVLVNRVDRSLIELRTSIALSPSQVESGTELVDHKLQISNQGKRLMSGVVALAGPKDWELTPAKLDFNLMPKRSIVLDVKIRYPLNEPAGERPVVAKLTLTEPRYYLEVPLTLTLGLKGIEVHGRAIIEGKDLILRHTISNRTDDAVHFRGAADAPGRERQYRPFSTLRPGDTQTVEYHFSGGVTLRGSKVRLRLREMNDGPRTHALELVVP